MTTLQKARHFIYRNARPLDLARWQYHFENGSKEAVLNALSYYQNDDGGFGHALEADYWNPNSTPIQTWVATEILHELDFKDSTHPVLAGILSYLASGQHFSGRVWYNTVTSNNGYPHAPWWHTESESSCHHDYNPTACLAGFLIRFAEKNSELYRLGCRIANQACEQLPAGEQLNDMHTLLCYVRLFNYMQEADCTDVVDLPALKAILMKQVTSCITQDTAVWETSYVCKPSQFFNTKDSIYFQANKEIAQYECDYILNTQLEDGSWNIPWGWQSYPEQWAISKNWWKSNVILVNMRYLQGMHRIT